MREMTLLHEAGCTKQFPVNCRDNTFYGGAVAQ